MKRSKSPIRIATKFAIIAFVMSFLVLWWAAGISTICPEGWICYAKPAVEERALNAESTAALMLFFSFVVSGLTLVAIYRDVRSEVDKD